MGEQDDDDVAVMEVEAVIMLGMEGQEEELSCFCW